MTKAPAGRGRVALHAPYLWPALAGGTIEFTGGAEVQQAAIARGLAARGFDVRVVTCDFGQPATADVDGLRVLRSFPPRGGVPGLRFLHPRLTRAAAALWRAGADVYYARGAGQPAGLAADVARLRGAGFVFGAAHDHDALASLPLLPNPRERWWYRRALAFADAVIAQTAHQRESFRREFHRDAEVIPNLVEIPDPPSRPQDSATVLWIGTWKPSKRPEWVIELAHRLPHVRFTACGVVPPAGEGRGAWETAVAAGRALPNLDVLGFLTRAQIAERLRAAALLLHTSPAEGFSNTMLEAWAHGVPTLSVVDPDGIVARERLGGIADTPERLAEAVARWMADAEGRAAAGARARAYAAARHAPGPVLEAYAACFDRAIARARARGGQGEAAATSR